jgi:hypothetical protein
MLSKTKGRVKVEGGSSAGVHDRFEMFFEVRVTCGEGAKESREG